MKKFLIAALSVVLTLGVILAVKHATAADYPVDRVYEAISTAVDQAGGTEDEAWLQSGWSRSYDSGFHVVTDTIRNTIGYQAYDDVCEMRVVHGAKAVCIVVYFRDETANEVELVPDPSAINFATAIRDELLRELPGIRCSLVHP